MFCSHFLGGYVSAPPGLGALGRGWMSCLCTESNHDSSEHTACSLVTISAELSRLSYREISEIYSENLRKVVRYVGGI